MTASVLVAAGITALVILQSAKEAAIMRILGTTKRKVRGIIIAEQALICLFGLALGIVISWLLGGVSFAAAGLYLAGCVVSAIAFSIVVSNKKPLTLIQIKE